MRKNFFVLICSITILLICGDVELNPGSNKIRSSYNFSYCHWNLFSIAAHNFPKTSFLGAYNAQSKVDLMPISDTYLDSRFPDDDTRLNLQCHNLVRADNPNKNKRSFVCLF